MKRLLFGFLLIAAAGAPAIAAAKLPTGEACALDRDYRFLADLLFAEAGRRSESDAATLLNLKRASSVNLTNARVIAYQPVSGQIECTGTLVVTLPAAAKAAGPATVQAEASFTAEPGEQGGFTIIAKPMPAASIPLAKFSARLAPTQLVPARTIPQPPTTAAPPVVPAVAPRAARPGFDCAFAATPVEILICSDPAIADRDREVSDRYFALRARLAPARRTKLLSAQRAFLRARATCATPACLAALYSDRLAALDALPASR